MATQEEINAAIKKYKADQQQKRLKKISAIKQSVVNPTPTQSVSKSKTSNSSKSNEKLYSDINEPMSVELPKEDKNLFTPAPSIKTYSKDNKVIGIEDYTQNESVAAKKDEYFTQESITQVEKERADVLQKNARLESESRTAQVKQEALYNEYFNDKGNLKQPLQNKVLSGIGIKSLQDKKVNEYEQKAKKIESDYYKKTFSIYTGDNKPNLSLNAKDMIFNAKPTPYNSNALQSEKVGTLKGYIQANKELKESGYYNLQSRPQSITTSFSQEQKDILRKGSLLESQQNKYIQGKAVKYVTTIGGIAIGGAFVSKAIGSSGLASNILVKGTGTALNVGFGGYVAAKSYFDIYKPIKEKDYATAIESGADLSSELIGVKLMTLGSKTKVSYDRPIIQREGNGYRFQQIGKADKNIFGGMFKKDINVKGFIKESGELAYTTTTSKNNKILSEITTSLKPTSYGFKGYKGNKPIEIREDLFFKSEPISYKGQSQDTISRRIFKESVRIQAREVETGGLFRKETPFSRKYVSDVLEIGGLSAPLKTTESNIIGNERLRFKGSRVSRILKAAALSPLSFSMGLQGESSSLKFAEPKTSLKTVSGYDTAFKLNPSVLQSPLITPKLYTGVKTDSKLKSLEFSNIKSDASFKSKPLEREKLNFESGLIQKPKEDNVIKTNFDFKVETKRNIKPILDTGIIQEQGQEIKPVVIQKPEQIQSKEFKKVPPVPIIPPPPTIIIPPIIPRFGLNKLESKPTTYLRGFRQQKRYTPSLLGIARGTRATKTTGLSGYEVRGVIGGVKKETSKSFKFGGYTLTPKKDGISMKFKVKKDSVKIKKKVNLGKMLLTKIQNVRGL